MRPFATHANRASLTCLLVLCFAPHAHAVTNIHVLAWNNLGMHCMDSAYSIFSILPPYNVPEVQIVQTVNNSSAVLLRSTNGVVVTYEAVADPDGSINRTSVGKTDFWQHLPELFGFALPPDVGLPVPGPHMYAMPGVGNTPQRIVTFETNLNWFVAYGLPIVPYDDAGKPNSYPLIRVRATTPTGAAPASTDAVIPVSDEMDCKLCHLSGSGAAAEPAAGWVNDRDPGRDYRLNILRMHDQRMATNTQFAAALAARGFSPGGLYATVVTNHHAILCAACHQSEALPGSGYGTVPPLTRAIHSLHAGVVDPRTDPPRTLNDSTNRTACYTCHPGGFTACLRGAMGEAIGPDGGMSIQCTSCHGPMSAVGSTSRTGWINEPNCQACHTGTATSNGGQIRFTSAFATATDFSNGTVRLPTDRTFATSLNAPAPGLSLFRFSRGHGSLVCSACHGSTHAEFPSRERNDNLANIGLQGHIGQLVECATCHGTAQPISRSGGPHGLHTVGTRWVGDSGHRAPANRNPVTDCQKCHGTDYRGTVLSRMKADRKMAQKENEAGRLFWRGATIGCYSCHNGPSGDSTAPAALTVAHKSATTGAGVPVTVVLTASGAASSWRIVTQGHGGGVALAGNQATYIPNPGYSGTDRFTFAAYNGVDSSLGTGTVTVVAYSSTNDGVPDWWRATHFGGNGQTTNGLSAATADPDGDRVVNLGEFLAGTDPLDSRSVLRFIDIARTGTACVLTFASVLGERYHADRATNLIAATWRDCSGLVWGHTDSTVFSDTNAAARPRAFYRMAPEP